MQIKLLVAAAAVALLALAGCDGMRDATRKTDVPKLKRLAAQGDHWAQNCLGACYGRGDGVVRNTTEAVKWYRMAAEQGDALAQVNLGSCYSTGTGVLLDMAEALTWFRKAAAQGEIDALYLLGHCYVNGTGVSPDFIEAYKYFLAAESVGPCPVAAFGTWRAELSKQLSAAQMAEAQMRALQWRADFERSHPQRQDRPK